MSIKPLYHGVYMNELAKPKTSPKDFFLYLTVMAMLYVSTGALIALWFDYINYLFPDQLQFAYDFYSGSIRWYIALLLTIFPAFVAVSWYAGRELEREPEKRELSIRKWLLYLTLTLAAASMLTDIVVLINTFLSGEITTRFILKVLTVLIVAGTVVAYYVFDLRGVTKQKPALLRLFTLTAAAVVFASIVGGFFIVGTPATQRALRFDQTRVSDLQSVQWQIVTYWQQKQMLPEGLNDLNDAITGYTVPLDPETGKPYRYERLARLSFKLCASFNRQSVSSPYLSSPYPVKGVGLLDSDVWNHEQGESCFERTIDPDRYPPTPRY